MAQFLLELSLVRPEMLAGPTEAEMQAVQAHFTYWQGLTEAGVALVVGRTQDDAPNGYAIFLAEDLGAAEGLVNSDPGVGPVFIARVRPYHVALLGDAAGFVPA